MRHSESPKVIHIVPRLGRNAFGLGKVARNLSATQIALGFDSEIWCWAQSPQIAFSNRSNGMHKNRIQSFPTVGPSIFRVSPGMFKAAFNLKDQRPQVVHQHSLWTSCSISTLILGRRHNLPVVIAPHGTLGKWALKKSEMKKRIALWLYEYANLSNAMCLHATAESEVFDFRSFGHKGPIALIPNGVRDYDPRVQANGSRFRTANNLPDNTRILFFLSRITPKKGILMLLDAISKIEDLFFGWTLIIAGSDEFNHTKEVKNKILSLNLEKAVRILGPLYDQEKRDAFEASEIFVLPSYSEGSPMVVLDSLVSGVPVITTKASHWKDLNLYRCGWWTEISVEGLADALTEALQLNSQALAHMGHRGRQLVLEKYSWDKIAQQTVALYNWLLGRGGRPAYVITD